MSVEFSEKASSYVDNFKKFQEEFFSKDIKWITELKEGAISSFSRLGFPTPRDEDWRFTNLAPIYKNSFQLNDNGHKKLPDKFINKFSFKSLDCIQLVFINGHYSKEFSNLEEITEGVVVGNIASMLEGENSELIKEHLAKYATYESDAFTALNTAYFEDGVFIYVPKSTVLNKPVHVLYVSTDLGFQSFLNPRNLIVVEENSELKIVEHYVSDSDVVYFSNVVTEIVIGENSNVEHYMLELESKKAFNISTLRVQQARSSNINSHSILVGGAIVRNNVHPVLNGEGCNSLINGLFISNNRQHMDNFMMVEHASPHCDSRQLYNGILDGRSRGVFHGRIVVHEGAVKTDAKQTNRNLLLSDTAQIDTKPQLEIYNDDVKCTHGATIGQMDENALFYLRSRGVSLKEAQAMMLQAFTFETLESMTIEPIKDALSKLIIDWFDSRSEQQ